MPRERALGSVPGECFSPSRCFTLGVLSERWSFLSTYGHSPRAAATVDAGKGRAEEAARNAHAGASGHWSTCRGKSLPSASVSVAAVTHGPRLGASRCVLEAGSPTPGVSQGDSGAPGDHRSMPVLVTMRAAASLAHSWLMPVHVLFFLLEQHPPDCHMDASFSSFGS